MKTVFSLLFSLCSFSVPGFFVAHYVCCSQLLPIVPYRALYLQCFTMAEIFGLVWFLFPPLPFLSFNMPSIVKLWFVLLAFEHIASVEKLLKGRKWRRFFGKKKFRRIGVRLPQALSWVSSSLGKWGLQDCFYILH